MNIEDCANVYMELAGECIDIIKLLYKALEIVIKVVPVFREIEELKEKASSLNFLFLDFRISIETKVCASKNNIFIEWYLNKDDFLDSKQKILIIKDTVDSNKNIISSSLEPGFLQYIKQEVGGEENILNLMVDAKTYFINNLQAFCEKIDEFEFKRKVDIS